MIVFLNNLIPLLFNFGYFILSLLILGSIVLIFEGNKEGFEGYKEGNKEGKALIGFLILTLIFIIMYSGQDPFTEALIAHLTERF